MARSIYCSKCKLEKEEAVRNESYCKACKSDRMKRSKMNKRIRQGLPPTRPVRQAFCNDCIAKLESNEDIRGRCAECHRIGQQLRVETKRVEQGLPAKTLRDSTFCHTCNIPKVDGRCGPCRQRMATERKAKKRAEAGKRPWGEGRPLTCYKCNEIKENPKNSHCNACASTYNKNRWKAVIAPIANQKEITLICECGKEKESTRKFYCNECLKENKRERTKIAAQRRRDKWKENGYILKKEPLTEEQKLMRKASRDYLNCLIRQGVVTRLDCEICGSNKNVEAHHDDYTKPLDIRWLCRTHHDEHHKLND